MSNCLSLLAQTTASAPAAREATGVDKFFLSLVAVGVCVLLVYLVPRVVKPQLMSLANTPGRPNRVNPLHVALVALVFVATMDVVPSIVSSLMGWTPSPTSAPSGEPPRFKLPPEVLLPGVLCAQAAAIVATLAVASWTFRGGVRRGLGFDLRHWLYDSVRGVLGYLIVLPLVMGLLWVSQNLPFMPKAEHELLQWFHSPQTPWTWRVVIVVSAVVAAPIAEEMFFRGLLQSMLRRYLRNAWLAVLASAVIFAAVHWGDEPQAVPSLAALGVALGYLYERSGRLIAPILLHGVFNGVNLAIVLAGGD